MGGPVEITFEPEARQIGDNEYEVRFYADSTPGVPSASTRDDLVACTIIVTVWPDGEQETTRVTHLGFNLVDQEDMEARRGRFEEEAREFIRPQANRTRLN